MTNREQYLSSLTDEELADMLGNGHCLRCPVGFNFCNMYNQESCNETILRWLKQDREKETEKKEHKGTFDDPLPQPKYEPPKIMLV